MKALRRLDLRICLALLAAVGIVYARTAWAGFVNLDDGAYVKDNPIVLAGLSWAGIKWAFTTFWICNWHPVTWLSHMLDASLFGKGPAGPHLMNALYHGLNGAGLYLLLRRITGATWRSAAVAALFALHPVHVESVAWISERKDVLSTLFTLASLHAYAGYVEGGRKRGLAWAALWHALALMAKPMPVSLPLLLLVLDVWPLRRLEPFTWRRLAALSLEKWPFALLSAASCWVTVLAQKGAIVKLSLQPISWRLFNASWAYVRYLGKMVWPSGLSPFYPYTTEQELGRLRLAGTLCLALLALVTWAVVRERGRRPQLLAGWIWFLVSLLPVIGLVQVGSQAMADRYTYLPLIGPFVALVWWAAEGAERSEGYRKALAIAGSGVLVLLGGLSWIQAGYWESSTSLFGRALSLDPANPIALVNLGQALAEKGDQAAALPYFQRAVERAPTWFLARKNLAMTYYYLGRRDQALPMMGQALFLDPLDGDLLWMAARALAEEGRREEAVKCLRDFLALEPRRMGLSLDRAQEGAKTQNARILLGLVALDLGWNKEATRMLEAALAEDPGNAQIKLSLAKARKRAPANTP
ncbi:MAG TPA: tetratricopeptide repeat protein [Holophaga sp.]|nr:tetratricopeptide repeat protein [Holophaga sp.]